MKKAAVFNDLSGFGKCSLTAAIPVLSAQGVQCCPMASAVLTNQTGYEYHKCTDLTAMIKDYIDNWQKNNAHFDGIYSASWDLQTDNQFPDKSSPPFPALSSPAPRHGFPYP